MRTTHWKSHLLPLLLLSLHSVSVCLAASCIFDEYVNKYGPLNIATAKDQPIGKHWEHLRIVASTKDLDGKTKYCVKSDDSIHDRSTQSAEADCEDIFSTVNSEQKLILMGILERAIALHTDRLLVKRAVGPLVIPRFSTDKVCKYLNVPEEHHTAGVANADMVLYVSSVLGSGDDAGTVSLGMTCAKSAGGRPIAGVLFFGPVNVEISRHTVRLATHHIAHALGFSYKEMHSRNMIMNENVRDKPNLVAVVKSDKTRQITQAHYGCPTAKGMELEDGEKNDKKTLSHWERRNAKDELMAEPVRSSVTAFMGFYTNITLAFFEDMGVYKANFQMAEHMEYGHKAGCEFLTDKCMGKDKTKGLNMFCDDSESTKKTNVCTTDRLGLGVCALKEDYNPPLPLQFQYFASPKKGGVELYLTDYCPVIEQLYPHGCSKSTQQENVPGSLFGKNSMCLDGSELKVKKGNPDVPVSAVCAEISCAGGSVKVKYHGDTTGKWYDCPEGQSLTPSSTSASFVSGKINCPKYKEVCTVAPDGSSLVPKVVYKSMEPTTKTPPTASQDPKESQKPTGQPNDSNSGGKSKDGSSVPFGLISSLAFLVLSFAGYLIS